MTKRPGRVAFRDLDPPGARLRMMEPGEAEAISEIDRLATVSLREAGLPTLSDPPPPERFVPWLLAHEVFVAERDGAPIGFAAAAPLAELAGASAAPEDAWRYWLSGLAVVPSAARGGVGSALLAAVVARAGWFGHEAVLLSTFHAVSFNAPFYARRGFRTVPRQAWSASLAALFERERPFGVAPGARVVMARRR